MSRYARPSVKGTAVVAVVLAALALAASARSGPGLRTCTTAQLRVWVTHTGAAAGTVGGYLAFTNRDSRESL